MPPCNPARRHREPVSPPANGRHDDDYARQTLVTPSGVVLVVERDGADVIVTVGPTSVRLPHALARRFGVLAVLCAAVAREAEDA